MQRTNENPAAMIRREALRLGITSIGFSPVIGQEKALARFSAMIAEKRHGEMKYLETGFPARADPSMLLAGIKTIISAALCYNRPEYPAPTSGIARISRHAAIDDYHRVVHRKLEELLAFIHTIYEKPLHAVITVDSSPVLEKAWAESAGIGRTGKNTLLNITASGSYIVLGELLIDREIREETMALPNHCGACRKCIENCPTGAIVEPGKLDARRCISYLTIELKRDFTAEESRMVGNWLFGCDLCQECCPANQSRKPAPEKLFAIKEELLYLTPEAILNLTGSTFRKLFSGTPIYRIGLKRLKRNARAVMENISSGSFIQNT
ncbi:MAG: tRNA epoxyqueuosine(34) reductase QueG [Chlorobium sp.]|uniref:tRNA epoxyqueuosine(34) reductase QueG n=1 Tax=Chlorobium sp. TaxID=1095 RepID=UPI0025C26D0F|nr:tRNA epoxyqueuosine(34) reductase QueG [Chlorobium sp.]MCF8216260.1 tRNA epoxyqueuosine(34) reductase QueG [Chlorobium sp.]MCF8271162.1 tRNA epoxyqueuosine(34) reductase QueG [Chlorobium sp.]MCF8287574.1 tRNA epoxyqueuosine(34) reductase QueG [Chlorobium sp.]MCF8291075.1 tRNA epoxyqueuosine(34) reductase QueG [Chlorobium sp.]MCF8385208.1 tRNA epoxyqueuosine(34) reductase QueG [Chlorobium sp.]